MDYTIDEAVRHDLVEYGLDRGADDAAPSNLVAYLLLLARWSATHNLTAVRDMSQMRVQHLSDCLAVIPSLRRRFHPESPIHVLDVGSGGGLPGVVLSILHPAWRIDCIDSVAKKAAFIRQVAGQLQLPRLSAIHGRVERVERRQPPTYDLIISRAFSDLRQFVALTRGLLKPDGFLVAMKGKIPEDEIGNLTDQASLITVESLEVQGLEAERCLIYISSQR